MSAGEESRENVERFGKDIEEAFRKAGDAVRDLQDKDQEPEEPRDDGGVDVDVDVSVNR